MKYRQGSSKKMQVIMGIEYAVEYGAILIIWLLSIACMIAAVCELLESKKDHGDARDCFRCDSDSRPGRD